MPERIQLQRTKGWRMPPNTVKVDRTTIWGNPFGITLARVPHRYSVTYRGQVILANVWQKEAARYAVDRFRNEVAPLLDVAELHGKNLACWCHPSHPCHADVLLDLANR